MNDFISKKLEETPELLTIGQVAELFKIHPDTLRNWEKSGELVPLRVGPRKDRRYRKQDIETIVAKMGSKLTLQQLEQFLWKSADILRGKIDSSDYKKYIFGLLFYKRISDVWDEEYKKVIDEYKDKALAEADYNHRFQVPKDCKWEVLTQTSENIGQKLNDIFDKITNVNSPKLDKIFDDLDFANKDRFPNETIQKLVNHFTQYNFGSNYISSDLLGDAYEYLIKEFAADAGKKGGEFYTPREVERIIIGIVKPHQKDHIYDPTVGSGGFLLEAYNYLKAKTNDQVARTLYLYGQEINISTFAIAKINMFLHGLDSSDIRRGDTLANPQFLNNLGNLQTFDIVVANPPYSIKDWEFELFKTDKYGRTKDFDAPPDKNADFAFVLHIIKSLNTNGRAGIVLPHGVLFRAGNEGKIREQIIKNDLIEAIIGLPPRLFYGTPIPAIILILNKNKRPERQGKVIFINAEDEFETGRKQNYLRKIDIEKIIKTVDAFQPVPRYAEISTIEQIAKKEYFLNIRRYVDASKIEPPIDLAKLDSEIEQIERELVKIRQAISELLIKRRNKGTWKKIPLRDILIEHKTLSTGKEEVHSVSVKKGIINQIEHLGRSFSAKDTSKYKLVKPGDIVYTKSPTGDFPFGIIKQSKIEKNAIVSPLYGVFTPINSYLGTILDAYFESEINANNYLQTIVSKGAKNTINISNETFLSKGIYLPVDTEEQREIASIIEAVRHESLLHEQLSEKYNLRKRGLSQDIFSQKVEVN
ncbi:MAG TPA: type I restriction-modification system subunit M [Patescibacteria group bacterium]|nr:type I restriction-modification system subunit M [Patescibacteria group bacterium]